MAPDLTLAGTWRTFGGNGCKMDRQEELEGFRSELKGLGRTAARERFAPLFQKGCALLELDDEAAARVFDTSRPTVSRWRRGKMVPPAAWLILRFMGEEIEARVRQLRNVKRAAV